MNKPIPLHDITPVDLYAKREKIHPRLAPGRFRDLRRAVGGVLLALYFGLVWCNWQGRQAIWWDLPARKFNIFGATFWPQDFILLSGLLIACAFGLFFITVLAGRIWCGYACPQSVWTWLFLWCERITEGDRANRIKLDQAPRSPGKLARRTAKHLLWLGLGLLTGLTFVGYFTPIRALVGDFFTGGADGWAYFWVAFFTLATYLNAGWLREQVCIHMCPYARFQSVMFDAGTLAVGYDAARGEHRGARRRDSDPRAQGLGDCIDCTLCVQVCPTGIDIRDGLQIACIGCAACIDACDSVMDKMNYPRGLIGYRAEQPGTRLLRPRLVAYGAVLGVLLAVLSTAFWLRPLVELDVIKDRLLWRENAAGRVENVYRLKVLNKSAQPRRFAVHAEGLPGLTLDGVTELDIAPGAIADRVVRLNLAYDDLPGASNTVTFILTDLDDTTEIHAESRFSGPASQ